MLKMYKYIVYCDQYGILHITSLSIYEFNRLISDAINYKDSERHMVDCLMERDRAYYDLRALNKDLNEFLKNERKELKKYGRT